MVRDHINDICNLLGALSGAEISAQIKKPKKRSELHLWFSDIGKSKGPVFTIKPSGLNRHNISLQFRTYSDQFINQIKNASIEQIKLSQNLLNLALSDKSTVLKSSQLPENWTITDKSFYIEIEISGIRNVTTYPAYRKTCEAILLPLISAIAELIGYEEEIKDIIKAGEMEGKIQKITIIKRERSKRNRLLCLRAHGDKCKICKFIPKLKYGEIGSIIEVHHIQPLSLNSEVRSYDPTNDLIPLCPNCHRAIHKKRPTPYSPQELIEIMTNAE